MNNLNVFKNYYYIWKYPSCWFKNIKIFFKSFKYGIQRARAGISDKDTWNFDYFLSQIIGQGLIQLSETSHGWPDGKFATPEEWEKYLKDLGNAFLAIDEYTSQKEINKYFSRLGEIYFDLWD